jgi:hypothetical protein
MSELAKGFSEPLNIFISGEIGDAIVSLYVYYAFFETQHANAIGQMAHLGLNLPG